MKKKNLLIALVIILVVGLTAIIFYFFRGSGTIPKAQAPEKQARVFKIGSQWLYQTPEATVSVKITSLKKIGKEKAFVYEYRPLGKKAKPQGVYYLHNEKGLWLAGEFVDTTSVTFKPQVVIFKNPIKIGGYWQTTYERSDLPGVKFVYKSKITKFFKGKTDAGVFDCYLIEQSVFLLQQPNRVFKKTYWYSPEVGIVYHASKSEMVSTQSSLIKYKLN